MKKILYFIEFVFIKFLFFLIELIGYKNGSDFGNILGKILGPFFRSRKLIEKNLEQANISKKISYKKIINNVYGNYGRILAEYPFLKKFRNDQLDHYIEIEGLKNLENIKLGNKTAVFISGHFNNFELMAMQIEKAGVDLCAIYRPLNLSLIHI